jgi:hypothetical protein
MPSANSLVALKIGRPAEFGTCILREIAHPYAWFRRAFYCFKRIPIFGHANLIDRRLNAQSNPQIKVTRVAIKNPQT